MHRAEGGNSLRVGRIGGLMGRRPLLALEAQQAELRVALDQPPPAKLPLTLVLALPRPKMLKRAAADLARHGRPRVVLLNSYRVEKSFCRPPSWPEAIRDSLCSAWNRPATPCCRR